MDEHKEGIKKFSKMKWEKPELVILMREPETAAGGGSVYIKAVVAEVDVSACLVQ